MTVDVERAESRLRNIQKVRPILAALRTISLSSWQMARNRQAAPRLYGNVLLEMLRAALAPSAEVDRGMAGSWQRARRGVQSHSGDDTRRQRVVVMVVGSERGLCGRYNRALLERLARALDDDYGGAEVELMGMGTRMIRDLRAAGHDLSWTRGLSVTALPSFSLARESAAVWLRRFELHDLDAVDILHNADLGAGIYHPNLARIIPVVLPTSGDHGSANETPDSQGNQVILETDVPSLCARIVAQAAANTYYQILLDAASTEHAARFQLMESATQNADDLSEELTLAVQAARRQAITRQMQELAVGAGLLNERSA